MFDQSSCLRKRRGKSSATFGTMLSLIGLELWVTKLGKNGQSIMSPGLIPSTPNVATVPLMF